MGSACLGFTESVLVKAVRALRALKDACIFQIMTPDRYRLAELFAVLLYILQLEREPYIIQSKTRQAAFLYV